MTWESVNGPLSFQNAWHVVFGLESMSKVNVVWLYWTSTYHKLAYQTHIQRVNALKQIAYVHYGEMED